MRGQRHSEIFEGVVLEGVEDDRTDAATNRYGSKTHVKVLGDLHEPGSYRHGTEMEVASAQG